LKETTVPIVEFIPPFKMDNDKYIITLPDFEGPLDLLLFFIKRDELNIYDIPISKITEEF
jgi:segregation and condensation protein A